MQNVVIDFSVKNEEILQTIELLEKIGQVEKGVADEFRKSAAIRKSANDAAAASAQKSVEETEKAKKSVERLNTNLKSLTTIIAGGAVSEGMRKLGAETEKAAQKTTSLKAQLRAMKAELATLDEGSARFNELSVQAARLEDRLGDVQQRVRNLASDTKGINALISGAQGITGAFAVAEGATALFGAENEQLQKSLLKVNALMAILNGLQQVQAVFLEESAAKSYLAATAQGVYSTVVGTSTGALKLFRIALAATGIGLIVIAVAALAANFDKVTAKLRETFPALNGFGKLWDQIKASFFGFLSGFFEGMSVAKDILVDLFTGQWDKLADDASNAGTRISKAYNEAYAAEEKSQADARRAEELEGIIANEKRKIAIVEAYGKESYNMKLKQLNDELELLRLKTDGSAKAEEEIKDKQNEIDILKAQQSKKAAEKLIEDRKIQGQATVDIMQDGLAKELAQQELAFREKAAKMREAGVQQNVITELFEREQNAIKAKYEKQDFDNFVAALNNRISAQKAADAQLAANAKADSDGRIKFWEDQENAKLTITRAAAVGSRELTRTLALDEMMIQREYLQKQLQDEDITAEAKKAIREKLAGVNIDLAKLEYDTEKQFKDALMQAAIESISGLISLNQSYYEWEVNQFKEQMLNKQITQQQYDQKVREAKKREAQTDRLLSIFRIGLSTAEAIVKFLATPGGPAGIALSIAAGITGAAELAAVASKPIPQFFKGTKNAPPGFKWVGEKGPELIHTPGGDMILPHEKSVKFARMFFDDESSGIPMLPSIMLPAGSHIGQGAPEFDYRKLGRVIAREFAEIGRPEVSIHIKNEFGSLRYQDERYG